MPIIQVCIVYLRNRISGYFFFNLKSYGLTNFFGIKSKVR